MRSYTLVKWGYSLIYYIVTSAAAYWILVQTSAMPAWLGGHGDPMNFFRHCPTIPEATQAMHILYTCQFGKNFSRFFGHVFIRQQGSFYEYTLHHALSTILIIFSYLTNFWLIGIMLLLLHDITDCTLICGRGYREKKNLNKYVLHFFYTLGFLNWIFWRVFVLFYACIFTAIKYDIYEFRQKLTDKQQ